ncbi:unnamed protein product [Rangifer tarandus platyrhynchus]|uniref:Uncharacterized protein n=1 Tax=Rangifer tarandus platyrhynchus TaxID=3082113 RepID=A0AC59ZNX4_RANTA
MPQDLMKQGGEEASHHGQRRRPPPHRQARPSAPPGGLSATPRPQVGSQVSPAHHAGAGCGTQGGHLTSPSPRSRLLPARLQPPGRESCKPAHCRVRRSATVQGPARGESAVQRGTQNASGSRPCRQRSDLATSRVTDAILDGESQGSGSQVVLPAARGDVRPANGVEKILQMHQEQLASTNRVFIPQGCCSRVPQTECLKQQTRTVSQFCRVGVHDRGIGEADSF